MSTKLKIESRVRRIIFYIQDIEKGFLQIPPFQRDHIWDNNQRKDLFDSLKKGYPIGSILLWKPDDDISFEKGLSKVGPYTIDVEDVTDFFYILDGFQRLSTLFGCLIDPEKKERPVEYKNEWRKKFHICYDLEKEEFFIPRTTQLQLYEVPVYKLIDTRAAFLLERKLDKANYEEQKIEAYMDRYHTLTTTFLDYSLPSIEIKGGKVDDAIDIFSRVNSKGSMISKDWMISALTYNSDKGFKLGTEIDNLLEELKLYNFGEIKRELILQCITNSFGKVYFVQMSKQDTRQIEQLVKRADFIEVTKKTVGSIKKAIQFLFEELLVIESKLLPSGNQLIFITDFFNQINKPTENQLKKLKEWFWITTYSNYFTMYSLSKQREAYDQFQKFLNGESENPVYNDKPDLPFEVTEFPNKIFFGSVRSKALLLFMLNYFNHFEKVDSQEIDGFKLDYLFYDIKDEKGNFPPESAVTVLDTLQLTFPKSKDMSFMLENEKEDYTRYFITEEMRKVFFEKKGGYQKNILAIRKGIIINAETGFIEKLGLRLAS